MSIPNPRHSHRSETYAFGLGGLFFTEDYPKTLKNTTRTVVSSHSMKLFVLALALLQAPVPKNNPSGTWQAESGSTYEIRQNGADVQVALVPGSNAKFKNYEVSLKNQNEANTYKGTG